MRTRCIALSVLFTATACEPESSSDELLSERSPEDGWSEPSSERAVRDPGFAFIDVDGDNKYDEDIDQEAVLDANGELHTPYDLVIPHDRWNPTLWHDEQVTITVGGDLDLDGEVSCLTSCIGSGCLVGTHTCSVDIEVAGDIITSNRSEIYAISGMGEAWISITAGGDIDLKSVVVNAAETYPSTDDGSIVISADGDLEAPSMDAFVDVGGHRTVSLSSSKQFLSLNKVDVSADTVELSTCRTAAKSCAYVPVVDLRKFQLDSATASLCIDEEDLTAGSTIRLTTNAKTSTNTCY